MADSVVPGTTSTHIPRKLTKHPRKAGKSTVPSTRKSVLKPSGVSETSGAVNADVTHAHVNASGGVDSTESADPIIETTKPVDAAIPAVRNLEAEHAESLIETKFIGDRIRRLRLKRSMGLVELGRRTGLSASFLSQLETGRVVPTLRNLSRIALVFSKDLSYFFQESKQNNFKTLRAKDRVRLPLGDKSDPSLISESMSALIPDRSLVPCIADFLPGSDKEPFLPHVFNGHEFVYIVEGSLVLNTEPETQVLEAGDIAWVDGATKRNYRSKDGPARALIITCPTKV